MDAPATPPPSFIPKKPVTNAARLGGSRAMGMVIFFIALLIFIASDIGAGIAFFTEQYLKKQISDKSTKLQQDQAAFDLPTIEDLGRLDQRMKNGESLMQRHYTAMTPLVYLGDQTLQNVQFTNYSYKVDTEGETTISLSGVASGFGSVALQSDQFSASKKFKDVVFSNIIMNPTGKGVGFSVSMALDPSLISYADSLGSQTGTTTTVTPMTPGTTFTMPPTPATSSTPSAMPQ
jgi:hypothetical protein